MARSGRLLCLAGAAGLLASTAFGWVPGWLGAIERAYGGSPPLDDPSSSAWAGPPLLVLAVVAAALAALVPALLGRRRGVAWAGAVAIAPLAVTIVVRTTADGGVADAAGALVALASATAVATGAAVAGARIEPDRRLQAALLAVALGLGTVVAARVHLYYVGTGFDGSLRGSLIVFGASDPETSSVAGPALLLAMLAVVAAAVLRGLDYARLHPWPERAALTLCLLAVALSVMGVAPGWYQTAILGGLALSASGLTALVLRASAPAPLLESSR